MTIVSLSVKTNGEKAWYSKDGIEYTIADDNEKTSKEFWDPKIYYPLE